ncbi:hypothetical protein [Ruminococcus flavefaciens]|uniref:hypothetical protein n=1 Tax=Ruminococcus flavefaciens TaxID=1265 RepID=UPI0004907DE1|nr:hypothetical protein [Ruminococcus flavefaciens]
MRIKNLLPKIVILVLCALAIYFILNKLNDVTGDDQKKIDEENSEFVNGLENNAVFIGDNFKLVF